MKPRPIHYVRATGTTWEQMRENVRKSSLYQRGDCILVWVNEGDWWSNAPIVDCDAVDAENRERAEYERLRAKFDVAIRDLNNSVQ